MFFSDVKGLDAVKDHLRRLVAEGRVPHALMLDGPEGSGLLPLTLAFAQYLCCLGERGKEPCGVCPSCVKFNKLAHPDLHFVFPIFKPDGSSGKTVVCNDFIKPWREFCLTRPGFSYNEWMTFIGADKGGKNGKQGMIFADEGDEILRKLQLKSYESVYKVMVIWLPEKMHPNCANRLLKILEEPPADTVFLLVTENAEAVLGTIYSRCQHIHVKGPTLRERFEASQPSEEFLQAFVRCMRGAYSIANFSPAKKLEKQEALIDLKAWSEEMAKWGRERQKEFLGYASRLIRENFMLNFSQPELSYLTSSEEAFSSKFFPFINHRNVEAFMQAFELAEKQIEQNVAAKMVFFDLALQCILLLKR